MNFMKTPVKFVKIVVKNWGTIPKDIQVRVKMPGYLLMKLKSIE